PSFLWRPGMADAQPSLPYGRGGCRTRRARRRGGLILQVGVLVESGMREVHPLAHARTLGCAYRVCRATYSRVAVLLRRGRLAAGRATCRRRQPLPEALSVAAQDVAQLVVGQMAKRDAAELRVH